jgi:hypothetical protein
VNRPLPSSSPPDGKRAFVCLNVANRIGVLTIDGRKVMYDKSMDIPSAFNPYNIDITPDGKYIVVSNTGALKNNADAEVIIDATGPHPYVVDYMTPGNGPEGFAIAPDGRTAAAPLLLGSGAKESDWFRTKYGELVLMSIGASGKLTVTERAPLGGLPEGVVYSPNSEYPLDRRRPHLRRHPRWTRNSIANRVARQAVHSFMRPPNL